MPEAFANAIRLYARHLFAEAAALLEPIATAEPGPAALTWWREVRFWLAVCYLRMDDPRGRPALLEIVHDAVDPERWAAAGWLCGEHRYGSQTTQGWYPPCQEDAAGAGP
jgi:hypothetical protein